MRLKGKDALEGIFGSVIDGSMSAKEAVGQLLAEIAKAQMLKTIINLPGMGNLSSGIGGPLGFAEGGFTGPGSKHQPAGIVHAGEFVISKKAVDRIGIGNLDALHRAAKSGAMGYADGGAVGVAGKVMRAASGRPVESTAAPAPQVTINAPISVTGSAGTAEQNIDLARQISRETERSMRGLIRDEITRQHRSGGMFRH